MGVGNFKKSKMYQHILNKDLKGLGDEMTNYNASKGKKMGGLVNRRQKEQEWFKQDPDAFKNKMELLKNKILRGY
jgi:GH24 family phage-related lysozyme (muramidase)